jgi:hypothetical protein
MEKPKHFALISLSFVTLLTINDLTNPPVDPFADQYRGITDHRIFLKVPRNIFEGVAPHRTNHPTLHQLIWSFYVVFMRLCK